jgi:hypothetical protein
VSRLFDSPHVNAIIADDYSVCTLKPLAYIFYISFSDLCCKALPGLESVLSVPIREVFLPYCGGVN